MTGPVPVHPDGHGSITLDGTWDFFPGDHGRNDIAGLTAAPIRVPALWEAEGWLDLDGPAWYRRRFDVAADELPGWWTLRFGAVMDTAEVHLNGQLLGVHESPFTPFELDVSDTLVVGGNELLVRVVDHPLDSPEHVRSPHGKQGWANHVFPSRPSLYLTYGGIWQSVTLRRHGPVRIDDVFIDSDPDHLHAAVSLTNVSTRPEEVRLGVRTLALVAERAVTLAPGEHRTEDVVLGATMAERWSPDHPTLHRAWVDVVGPDSRSDAREVRYGLRRIAVDGTVIRIDDVPYRMRSALVQGFRADTLYAEGSRDAIVTEVQAAKAMGFNTLRLHIKAFDPTYLDVCDELGMLLHCDLPVAEPIAHAELGADTELADRCASAIRAQIVRDRNHPSVILWSAMNELTLDGIEWRSGAGYEGFARRLGAEVVGADPTRPYIENDWVEPEPERVFAAPILTAHWYGRLHAEYLAKLDRQCRRWAGLDKPLFVTEFGDWGLPDMPELGDPPFWDTLSTYAASLATSCWPDSVDRFVRETQRYQGISDRLQAEVFRRHDHIGGYCLTELTDVPHELNGVLDLHRRPKPLAVCEVERMNQALLPMLELPSLVVRAGEVVRSTLHIANDGPALPSATIRVAFAGADAAAAAVRSIGPLPGYGVTSAPAPRLLAPERPGNHDLVVEVVVGDERVASNQYPVHVVSKPDVEGATVQLAGGGDDALALGLQAVGARVGTTGPLVVAEGTLDAVTGALVRAHLLAGGAAIVLAQEERAAPHYPVPVELVLTSTQWGSTEFHFTTDSGAVPSLPRRNVLVAEESTIQARTVMTSVDAAPFPDEAAVIAYKPVPDGLAGAVVGAHRVGPGRLVICQYRLTIGAADGDAASRALLADVVRWAAAPRPPLERRDLVRPDGRVVRLYSWASA